MRNVLDDYTLGEIEIRQSVSVASQNYRFELGAASGLAYPEEGRPIGAFIRISTRMFLYILAMPEDSYYEQIANFLGDSWTGREDRMKRIINSVSDLTGECDELPFWNINVD